MHRPSDDGVGNADGNENDTRGKKGSLASLPMAMRHSAIATAVEDNGSWAQFFEDGNAPPTEWIGQDNVPKGSARSVPTKNGRTTRTVATGRKMGLPFCVWEAMGTVPTCGNDVGAFKHLICTFQEKMTEDGDCPPLGEWPWRKAGWPVSPVGRERSSKPLPTVFFPG